MHLLGNRQLSRRGFLRASGFTVTGALLAACAVPQAAPTASEGGGPAPEPVTIQYWLPPTTEQAYREEKFNEFMEMHPDIVIDMEGADPANYNEATQLLFRQDEAPDVFWKYNLNLPQMIEADMLQPYPQVVQDYLRKSYPAAMFIEGINTWDGEIYGFWPVGPKTATRVLYCSNDKLAEVGAEPPTTWSELRDVSKALADAGGGQSYGLILGGKSTWDYTALVGGLAMSAGPAGSANGEEQCFDWREARMTFADDYFVAAMELCTGMLDDGSIFPGFTTISHTEARAGLANGWAGMYLGGWWDSGAFQTQFPDLDYSIVAPPIFDGGKQGFNHGDSFVDRVYISKSATNLDAIAEFLLFKFGPEYQIGWAQNGWFTALPEANTPENLSDPKVQALFATSDDIRSVPNPIARNVLQANVRAEQKPISPNWGDLLGGVFSGQIAPEDYAAEVGKYAELWRTELERAITEVQGRGIEVSLDDWIFPNWEPADDYTAAMYEELKV